jgi:putative transposase
MKREAILDNPEIHQAFIDFAKGAIPRRVQVGRYMLMPDHLHFFVAFSPEAPTLSLWMKSLKNSLSKILRHRGALSPHWQKDFFDHVMRSEESYHEKWNYVVMNPVRAGLVVNSSDWPYQDEICVLRFHS